MSDAVMFNVYYGTPNDISRVAELKRELGNGIVIHENDSAFWVVNVFYGMNMYVHKSTGEGVDLADLFAKESVDLDDLLADMRIESNIENYLMGLFLRRVIPNKLKEAIDKKIAETEASVREEVADFLAGVRAEVDLFLCEPLSEESDHEN